MEKKWWIAPAFIIYVLIGIWVGSTSYKINENWSDYSRGTKFLFYPVSTIISDGFPGDKSKLGIMGSEKRPQTQVTAISFLKFLNSHNPRASYILLISLVWPLKLGSLIFFVALFVALIMVIGVSSLLIMIGGAIATFIVWLVSLISFLL